MKGGVNTALFIYTAEQKSKLTFIKIV